MNRVVITGMGWVTPMGHSIDAVWKRLLNSESGIAKTTIFDAGTFPTTFSAEVKDYDVTAHVPEAVKHKSIGRNTSFALRGASLAVAGLLLAGSSAWAFPAERRGLAIGALYGISGLGVARGRAHPDPVGRRRAARCSGRGRRTGTPRAVPSRWRRTAR